MSSKDRCEIYCYDEAKVIRIQSAFMTENIERLAKVYKVLADENRAKIAYALCLETELCVCDIANIIQSSVATASHHLRTMKKMGLAKFRKDGKLAFYSLDDDHVKQLIISTLAHLKEGI